MTKASQVCDKAFIQVKENVNDLSRPLLSNCLAKMATLSTCNENITVTVCLMSQMVSKAKD